MRKDQVAIKSSDWEQRQFNVNEHTFRNKNNAWDRD